MDIAFGKSSDLIYYSRNMATKWALTKFLNGKIGAY